MEAAAGPRWYAVDGGGLDLATGRPPAGAGLASAAAALAAAPVVTWPVAVAGADGRRMGLAAALGRGGERVEEMLGRLVARPTPPTGAALAGLARATPGGWLDLPVEVVSLAGGVEASADVDPAWLAAVEGRRAEPRGALAAAGRTADLDAALNVGMLLATERFGVPDGDVAARIASGARLWLLGGAIAWALTSDAGPFAAWAELVACDLWPVGPTGGRLLVAVTG